MGINDRPGPGESVFRIRGGGEATGDDVEGHKSSLRATEDDDVEGHKSSLRATEDEDEDVEGHRASLR